MQAKRHLWDEQWFRDAVMLLIGLLALLVAYSLRAILLPVLMALALAYAFHPLISWLQRQAKIPRWLSTTGLLAIVLACALSLFLWLMPQLVNQTRSLIDRLPGYTDFATQKIKDMQEWAQLEDEHAATQPADTQPAETQPAETTQPADAWAAQAQPVGDDSSPTTQEAADSGIPKGISEAGSGEISGGASGGASGATSGATSGGGGRQAAITSALGSMDVSTLSSMLVQTFNVGLGVVGLTLSIGTYLVLAVALLLLGFFFFSWKFDRILAWFDSFIPDTRRPRVMHVIKRMDQAISAFVRGRLVQVSILTCVLCVGWAWVGVPYWLLLGVLGGMLNLVPYAAVISWPVAILLMWIDTASGNSSAHFSFMQVFFWPSMVYCVGQILDGWVVEPLVQGKATNLDPFTVLVAVIVGGSLLGILGTIIAVPATACLKILMEEVILPHVRSLIHGRRIPPAGES